MIIGVDFDNTIVSYDTLFHRLATERGLIDAAVLVTKNAVRDHLRRTGREPRWTALQGEVYGARLTEADPFPGVLEFFRACRTAGISLRIISHKTRYPFAGERHDLHDAARSWLRQQGFFAADGIGLAESEVHFELTKAEKLARIAACGCDLFIDDLPEILTDPAFPLTVERLLFAPAGADEIAGVTVARSWAELGTLPLRHRVASHFLVPLTGLPQPLSGGANNRVVRLTGAGGEPLLLKEYFAQAGDPRDRFAAEHAFYRYACEIASVTAVPQPRGWAARERWGLFEFVPGQRATAGQIDTAALDAALDFLTTLNAARHHPAARALPAAAEACFSLDDHLAIVTRRLERLTGIDGDSPLDAEARDFVQHELLPAWSSVQSEAVDALRHLHADERPLPDAQRCLSPSDFGFHNALQRPDGSWVFFDFEYAGWDDPAKLVCDFFCQPAVPVSAEYFDRFARRVAQVLGLPSAADFVARCRALRPVHQIKWCGLLLNEFLGTQQARRRFALGSAEAEQRKQTQLDKARATLAAIGLPLPL